MRPPRPPCRRSLPALAGCSRHECGCVTVPIRAVCSGLWGWTREDEGYSWATPADNNTLAPLAPPELPCDRLRVVVHARLLRYEAGVGLLPAGEAGP